MFIATRGRNLSVNSSLINGTMLHLGQYCIVTSLHHIHHIFHNHILMGILQQHTESSHTIANLCRTTHVVIVVTNCWKRCVSVESLCVAQKTECDTERSTCADNSGTARCQCLQGYYKHNPDDLSCLGRCASPQAQGMLGHRSIQLLTASTCGIFEWLNTMMMKEVTEKVNHILTWLESSVVVPDCSTVVYG